MSEVPAMLSELQAVNLCLSAIGQAPVSTLVGVTLTSDAGKAQARLLDTVRTICETGYKFNTEDHVQFAPDAANNILLPDSIARWVLNETISSLGSGLYDFVDRWDGTVRKVYDRYNHTYTITFSIYADVTYYLPFDKFPPHLRKYAAIRAARLFQQEALGIQEATYFTKQDEADAFAYAQNYECIIAKPNTNSNELVRQDIARRCSARRW